MPADPDVLLGGERLGGVLERLRAAVRPHLEIVGWATVELDRAGIEVAERLATTVGLRDLQVEASADDMLLGARCRALRSADGRSMLLLEPSTEGLLAAALARHGEGSVVLYLLADPAAATRVRAAGFRLTRPGSGPFGLERLVLAGPRWGPFLVLAGLDRPGGLRSAVSFGSGRA